MFLGIIEFNIRFKEVVQSTIWEVHF